jgi:hypothetical protein
MRQILNPLILSALSDLCRTIKTRSLILITTPIATAVLGDIAGSPSSIALIISHSNERPAILPPLESPGNWLIYGSWEQATPDMLALCEETKRLTALPAPIFASQTAITVADTVLLESVAPTDGVAVAVLQKFIAGTVGTQANLSHVNKRLALIQKGLHAVAGFSKKRLSPGSSATRLAPSFFLAPATTYPQALAVAQQAKARPLALIRASLM